jgi:hypothetical protein
MKATLEFYSLNYRKLVVMHKQFNDINHMNNFISYVTKKFNYTLNEIYHEINIQNR